MRALKFTLTGQNAFFKKPDVNTFLYFTYSQIHKVALLGVLGSIIGLKGYGNQKGMYPEYYALLKDLKVAIVPIAKSGDLPGLCSKKVQVFNNSVGYASKEAGGNLIVKEQWLENPMWEIYLLGDGHTYYNLLKEYLMNQRCVYIPYLGKNDHFATIKEVEEIELKHTMNYGKIESLFIKSSVLFNEIEDENDFYDDEDGEDYYKYEEKLPIALEQEHNQYVIESFVLTNKKVTPFKEGCFYQANEKVISFI
ncbi:MAG: type I-B CRISPR-associated protein Cas5b [Zhenhengia sp.]|uniref:type I-B CRISPR-associated protein Cas5b n=1 Tax=Zhenhengia sp. TaxID=2944208 RepID=UPI0039954B24